MKNSEISSLCQSLENSIPKIDGVEFKLELYEVFDSSMELGVTLSATFRVFNGSLQDDIYGVIVRKLHEITSNGQVLLELEK